MDYRLQDKFMEGHSVRQKIVSIVGLGGVGSAVAQILARNGIALRIVDRDRVHAHDAPRQSLFLSEDITKFKAKQGKKRLEDINADVKIRTFHEDLVENNMFLLEADLIIDTGNDWKTSKLAYKYAKDNKIPFIFSNYAGEKGNIIVLDKKQSKITIKDIEQKVALPSVEEKGAYSPITTLIGSIVAGEAIKNLDGEKNVSKLIKIDAYKNEVKHSTIKK